MCRRNESRQDKHSESDCDPDV